MSGSSEQVDVVIVGAGLAGLACARTLTGAGVSCQIYEASDRPGGRVRTDMTEGVRLDRGFQVLLTAYPECRAVLDYEALQLREFRPGALVRLGGRFRRVSDPVRRPTDALATLASGVGTMQDYWRVIRMRRDLLARTTEQLLSLPDQPARDYLRDQGFSRQMISSFFEPFFGGILLDRTLSTSARMFAFVFQMMARGAVAVPAMGMEEIPKQLTSRLPEATLRMKSPVAAVTATSIQPDGGGPPVTARAVVVAADLPGARALGLPLPHREDRSVTCLYYTAERTPLAEPTLVLSAEEDGPINNLAVMSEVSRQYAPHGVSLISVTVLEKGDDANLEKRARGQLRQWFGACVDQWNHVTTVSVPHAQPAQAPGQLEPPVRPVRLDNGVFVCGDHRTNASLNGALVSGRLTAQEVVRFLREVPARA